MNLEPIRFAALPADPSRANHPRPVLGALYSWVEPTPVASPQLVAWSGAAARLLDLERDPSQASLLGGNGGFAGLASCYGGHQFGSWAGQLGDGRALLLGERQGWEVQLKGAGPTPYSRHADGRAVLRSSLREFLGSEIMQALGVPTTRALSLVTTGEPVTRDMFYDGHPRDEPGAICCRLAPSFVRFGHFELLAHRGEHELLRQLLDFVLREHYPGLTPAEFFAEVCQRTARMVVEWLRVGFVHGVMNTDNMSILGLTIDYGPFGWLDDYNPGFTPNTTDRGGRYAYAQQGRIGLWNLDRLAVALTPLIPEQELRFGLEGYLRDFEEGYRRMLLSKLGLGEDPGGLVDELLALLAAGETDMTRFFRELARDEPDLEAADYTPPSPQQAARRQAWLERYRAVAPPDRAAAMNRVNPRIIPRNFLLQEVIRQAEEGDLGAIEEMLEAFADPYAQREDKWDRRRPDWARTAPGCSALSCSS